MKALLRDMVAGALRLTGVSGFHRLERESLLILTCHRVLPQGLREQYPLPGLVVTPEELRWVIATLQPFFEVSTVTAAHRQLEQQHNTRPLLAVSFDDGQWDNLHYAGPVLRELGVPATFYLPTAYMETDKLLWHDQAGFAWMYSELSVAEKLALVGNITGRSFAESVAGQTAPEFVQSLKALPPEQRLAVVEALGDSADTSYMAWARMMTWREAQQLQAEGHEIGSHGCSHGLLPQQTEESQRQELKQSMEHIRQRMDVQAHSFCYPNGDYDATTLQLISSCGYSNAVTTQWGNNCQGAPAFELRRCDVNPFSLLDRRGRLSKGRLQMRLAGYQPGL